MILDKEVKWGEFRVGELFEVGPSRQIFHGNNINIYKNQIEGSYPYVVRNSINNGVRGYVIEDTQALNDGNTLSFAQDTFTVFYQEQQYFTGNKVKILKARNFNLNREIGLFIASAFQKAVSIFSWGVGSTTESIANFKIQLPIIDNGQTPDYEYMAAYIRKLEHDRLQEVKSEAKKRLLLYIKAADIDSYELTDEDKAVLTQKVEWGEFKLEDILEWQGQKEINPLHLKQLIISNKKISILWSIDNQ